MDKKIERIIATKIKAGVRYYQVEWKPSWEPESYLDHCTALVERFWDCFRQEKVYSTENQGFHNNNNFVEDAEDLFTTLQHCQNDVDVFHTIHEQLTNSEDDPPNSKSSCKVVLEDIMLSSSDSDEPSVRKRKRTIILSSSDSEEGRVTVRQKTSKVKRRARLSAMVAIKSQVKNGAVDSNHSDVSWGENKTSDDSTCADDSTGTHYDSESADNPKEDLSVNSVNTSATSDTTKKDTGVNTATLNVVTLPPIVNNIELIDKTIEKASHLEDLFNFNSGSMEADFNDIDDIMMEKPLSSGLESTDSPIKTVKSEPCPIVTNQQEISQSGDILTNELADLPLCSFTTTPVSIKSEPISPEKSTTNEVFPKDLLSNVHSASSPSKAVDFCRPTSSACGRDIMSTLNDNSQCSSNISPTITRHPSNLLLNATCNEKALPQILDVFFTPMMASGNNLPPVPPQIDYQTSINTVNPLTAVSGNERLRENDQLMKYIVGQFTQDEINSLVQALPAFVNQKREVLHRQFTNMKIQLRYLDSQIRQGANAYPIALWQHKRNVLQREMNTVYKLSSDTTANALRLVAKNALKKKFPLTVENSHLCDIGSLAMVQVFENTPVGRFLQSSHRLFVQSLF